MRKKIVVKNDKKFMFPKRGKVGIHFLVTTEKTYNLSPNKRSNSVDFSMDDEESPILKLMPDDEIGQDGLFGDSFELEDFTFKTYKSHVGLLFCHYFEFEGYKMMRDVLVEHFKVDRDLLKSFKSTNQEEDFIPLEIRKNLSLKDLDVLHNMVFEKIATRLSKLSDELHAILKCYFPKRSFTRLDYFKMSNIELALDVESPPGVDLGSHIEIHERLVPKIDFSMSGHYLNRDHNSVSPLASTALAQCDLFPPYFWGRLKDKTEINIYLKCKSPSKGVGWLQRFERKFFYDKNMSGADKIQFVLNKNSEKGDMIRYPKFSTADELKELVHFLIDDTFGILFSSLNVSVSRSQNEVREQMGNVLQSYCRQNSLELYRRLCFPPWSFPVSMIGRPEGFPRAAINALKEEGIIHKEDKWSYSLDLSYFDALFLKKNI